MDTRDVFVRKQFVSEVRSQAGKMVHGEKDVQATKLRHFYAIYILGNPFLSLFGIHLKK
jgi:hypothetical protein